MALRHHERHFATRSTHTLEAILSHDTANHPAHQRHAAFTPACFALPSGTAPRKRTSHQGRANPHGAATSSNVISPHGLLTHYTTSNHITPYRQSSRSPATRRVYTSMFRAAQWHGKLFPVLICTTNWPRLSPAPTRACRTRIPPKVKRQVSKTSVSYETSSKSEGPSLQNQCFVRDFLPM